MSEGNLLQRFCRRTADHQKSDDDSTNDCFHYLHFLPPFLSLSMPLREQRKVSIQSASGIK